jgi:ParB family chromosome partitioning protein
MAKGSFKSRLKAQQTQTPLPASVTGIDKIIENKQPDTTLRDADAHHVMTHIARPSIEPAGQIIRVSVDDVYVEEQVRPEEDFEDDVIDGMVDSYESVGMLTPPRCFPRDKKGYRIWLGETRWRSAKKRGDQFIDVYVGIPPESDKKRIIGQLIENLQQSGLKPLATAVQFLKLKTDHGMTGEQIAKTVGKTTAFVSKHLRLVDAPANVTALLRDKVTSDVDLAYTLTQLSEVAPETADKLVEEARKKGITRTQVKAALDAEKGRDKISHAKSKTKKTSVRKDQPQQAVSGDWLVVVEFEGQEGTILTGRAPEENGDIWVKAEIGEITVEPGSMRVKGLRPAT